MEFLTDFKKHFWFCRNKYFLSNIRWQNWKFIVYFVHRKINSTKHFGLRYTPDTRSSPGRSVVTNQQRRRRSRSQKEAGSRWFSWMSWMDILRWSCLARKQLSSGWILCSWMYVIKYLQVWCFVVADLGGRRGHAIKKMAAKGGCIDVSQSPPPPGRWIR